MEELGYGKDYKYAHDYQGISWNSNFYPTTFRDKRIWHAQGNAAETKLAGTDACNLTGKTLRILK